MAQDGARGEEQVADVAGVADNRVRAGRDQAVVALDADFEAEEAPELAERPAPDARAADPEERAEERGRREFYARGVPPRENEIGEDCWGDGGVWEGAREDEKDLGDG